MADKFDAYREALVIETETIWGDEFEAVDPATREQVASELHKDPESVDILEYVRVHTGFCRRITVTEDDIQRVSG